MIKKKQYFEDRNIEKYLNIPWSSHDVSLYKFFWMYISCASDLLSKRTKKENYL